jgi:hypothetical protein
MKKVITVDEVTEKMTELKKVRDLLDCLTTGHKTEFTPSPSKKRQTVDIKTSLQNM